MGLTPQLLTFTVAGFNEITRVSDTNSGGKFTIDRLGDGEIELIVSKPGFKPFRQRVSISKSMGAVISIQIVLAKIPT